MEMEMTNGKRTASPFIRGRVTAGMLGLLVTFPVLAGRYELEKGKGVEVCEAYLENLNSFKPNGAFGCARPVNKDFPDFGKPRWMGESEGEKSGLLPPW